MAKKLYKASIDVSKINKEQIFDGKKGKYISVDIWVTDEADQYGNMLSIAQSFKDGDTWQKIYLGNGKPLELNKSIDTSKEDSSDLPF